MTRPVRRAEEIFLAMADLDPAGRDALMASQCGDDAGLFAEVQAMLAETDVPDDFLDPEQVPALDPAAIDGPLQPGARLGDYLVLHALGSGGMGVVYAAQQDRPHRTVAIKVLHRGARRPEITRRFELEAELLGRLQHPGIAQVYAFHAGDRTTPAYLVMELVPGPPITEYAQAHTLPYMSRVALGAKVCDAIQHAHERGIVHRDLKPANVLISEDGHPKILDFGIARATGLDLQLSTIQTLHGQLIGTLAYMSPEQLRGAADVDARSDVYGVGVLLYRLLSGRLPVDVGNVPFPEAVRRALEHEPTPLGLTDADLRGPLEQIIARAMARDRDRRYQSAAALAADLRAYVDGRPLSAAGEGRGGAMGRQVRRYRRTAVIAAAALAVAAGLARYAIVERRRTEAVTARLQNELSASRVERGRLLAEAGDLTAAESLLWSEYFARADNSAARVALRALYAQQPVLRTMAAPPPNLNVVTAVAVSAGGRRIAIAGIRQIELWDVRTLRRIEPVLGRGDRWVSASFDANGDQLTTVTAGGVVRTWEVNRSTAGEHPDTPELDRRVDRNETYQRSRLTRP